MRCGELQTGEGACCGNRWDLGCTEVARGDDDVGGVEKDWGAIAQDDAGPAAGGRVVGRNGLES